MTAHDHRVFVEGCHRCEMSADEMRAHFVEVRGRLRQLVGDKNSPWDSLDAMCGTLSRALALMEMYDVRDFSQQQSDRLALAAAVRLLEGNDQ